MKVVRFFLTLTFFALAGGVALSAGQGPRVSRTKLTFVRTIKPTKSATLQKFPENFQYKLGPEADVNFTKPLISGTTAPARLPAADVPTTPGNPISSAAFAGLEGLTHLEQRTADTGNPNGRNFSLEPPDQGLAVGNGFIVEAVNDAIAIFHTSDVSSTPSAPTPILSEGLNKFLGLAPPITQNPKTGVLTFGPFLSDPRVLFDGDTGRFFVTVLEIDLDPVTGNFGFASTEYIAVSQTNDPTGAWNVFALNVTNDGDAVFGSCPCFGDQPLLGADKFGFYLDTNAFVTPPGPFRGNQLYAVSKEQLETGTPPTITVTRFHNLTEAEGPAFSLQPAIVPPDGTFDTDNGGTEFLVGSLDFTGTLDNRLAIFALTNTSSLNTASPSLTLSEAIITTEVYGQPPSALQKPGPTPLLDFIFSTFHVKNHLELMASNDDRMQQVTFAAGNLWTSLNSVVQTPDGPVRTGGAFFILSPSVSGSGSATQVGATVFNQGYVAINSPFQNNVDYPAIGVNGSGKAIIGFSVVGRDFFPSAAYTTLDANAGAGEIVISGPGNGPEDGFSGYAPFGFRVARLGDYGAAAGDESGNLWVAGEMIPNLPRSLLANWGTFVTEVVP